MAQAIDGDLYVVYIDTGQDETPGHQKTLNANIAFAENMGARLARVKGKRVASAMAEFVNEKHIKQVVFVRSTTSGWKRFFYLSAIHQFLRDAPAVDVHIVTQDRS
jgi:two-component system, OmpR family, sensor histidine kinase KdpD